MLTTRPDGSTQSVSYNGLTVTSTNELGQQKIVTAHTRFASQASGDDHHVGIHSRRVVVGAGDANVFWLRPTRLVFSVSAPGRYRVKLRWSPYWKTSQGCVWRGPARVS